MPKFFVPEKSITGTSVSISGDDAFHIARSLRMAVGDIIEVSDGNSHEYLCRLEKIRDDECIAAIIEAKIGVAEPPLDITLFMAMPKGDKLEYVVQKAVELGALCIIPFESERCIKRPSPDKIEKMTARLGRIAHEAAKQCGRSRLPKVLPMIKFEDMLSLISTFDLPIFCYEGKGATPLRSVLEASGMPKTVCAIVGSEGGFSKREAESIVSAGGICVGLGPRILRCETAPDYVLSALSYHFER